MAADQNATRAPNMRHASIQVRTSVITPPSHEGMRAVRGVTSPVNCEKAAMAQKRRGGFSR